MRRSLPYVHAEMEVEEEKVKKFTGAGLREAVNAFLNHYIVLKFAR